MSTYSDLDREWYHDLEAQHDEFVRQEALDQAERLRESPEFGQPFGVALRGVGAAGESTGAFMSPEGRERHAVDATASQSAVSACSPAADPFLHWPEHDRALARERAEALRRVSEPVCMERIRPARDDDGLDFARGMVFAVMLSVPLWALLAGLLVLAW